MNRSRNYYGSYYRSNRGYKPPAVSRVRAAIIACPDCGAQVDEYCVSATGKQTGYHASRMRMATRMLNQLREQEHEHPL